MTKEQQLLVKQKIAEEYKRCASDPIYFINKYVKIQHPEEGTILFETYEFQNECIVDFQRFPKNIILKCRQMGITTIVSAYCTWLMCFHDDKNIVCLATKQDTAKEVVTKVKFAYDNLPSWLKPVALANNKLSLELKNGSKILAETAAIDSGRGKAVSLAILDEFAHLRDSEEVWTSIQSSTMHGGGNVIVLSTPNGIGNTFHKMWVDAETKQNEFNPISLHWTRHPKYNQAWRDNQTKLLGERKARQECDCAYLGTGQTVIDDELIKYYRENIVKDPILRSSFKESLWTWKQPDYTKNYLVSADVARGDAEDFSTAQVIDIETLEQCAEFKGKISPKDFGAFLTGLASQYNNALLVIENNSFGHTTIQECIDRNYPNLFYSNDSNEFINPDKNFSNRLNREERKAVPGHETTTRNRTLIISKLDQYMRDKEKGVIINSLRLIDELNTFIWNGNRPEAMRNYNDDLVMSMAIGLWIRDTAIRLKNEKMSLQKELLGRIGKSISSPISNVYSTQTKNPYLHSMGGEQTDLRWLL